MPWVLKVTTHEFDATAYDKLYGKNSAKKVIAEYKKITLKCLEHQIKKFKAKGYFDLIPKFRKAIAKVSRCKVDEDSVALNSWSSSSSLTGLSLLFPAEAENEDNGVTEKERCSPFSAPCG